MKQLTLFFILTGSLNVLNAQDIKNYVIQNTDAIITNQPDSVNYSDLEAIGNAIADARIVLMGEQDHGDAPTFLAKTRLIKYLHEKKGFNVLAFESDFFGLNYGWDQSPKNKSAIDTFLQKNIFPIWTFCDACEQLFYNYIPGTHATSSPIQITGFDNQMVLRYSSKYLSKILDSVLRSYNLPVTKEANYTSEIIPLVDSSKIYRLKDTTQYSKQLSYLLLMKEQLGQKLPANNFWMMVIDNLIAENREYRNLKNFNESSNVRDRQMALNLLWLSKTKYPNEKIIVWAHNAHISKYAGHYGQKFIDKNKYMGTVFDGIKDSSLKTYTIGFTSYSGKAGRLGSTDKIKVLHPKKNGFENWINESYNFAFVDFEKYNRLNPSSDTRFFMKGQHHTANQKVEWNKVYDGVFFVREMYSCKPLKK